VEHETPIAATERAMPDPAPKALPGGEAPVSTEPMPAAPVARRSRGTRLLNVALVGAVALAIAGVAFAAGRLTAPANVAAGRFPNGGQVFDGNGQGTQNGGQGGPGAFFSGGPTIEGTVESLTATTLTLKTASGQTIQIALDGTTTYHAQTDASASDVTAGGRVLVRVNLRGTGATGNAGGAVTNPTASDVTVVP
jgi:hypothetical protein